VLDYSGINSVFYFTGILSLVFTLIGCYYVWKWSKGNKQRVMDMLNKEWKNIKFQELNNKQIPNHK